MGIADRPLAADTQAPVLATPGTRQNSADRQVFDHRRSLETAWD